MHCSNVSFVFCNSTTLICESKNKMFPCKIQFKTFFLTMTPIFLVGLKLLCSSSIPCTLLSHRNPSLVSRSCRPLASRAPAVCTRFLCRQTHRKRSMTNIEGDTRNPTDSSHGSTPAREKWPGWAASTSGNERRVLIPVNSD